MPNEALYTVEDIAKLLGVHPETIRNWIKNGELGGLKLGGSAGYRISETDLQEFLKKRREAARKDD